jgi:hypothetical protein
MLRYSMKNKKEGETIIDDRGSGSLLTHPQPSIPGVKNGGEHNAEHTRTDGDVTGMGRGDIRVAESVESRGCHNCYWYNPNKRKDSPCTLCFRASENKADYWLPKVV